MWVKIDNAAPHHYKLLSAGPEAMCLWVAGLCYANRHATDGVILSSALSALYPTTEWTLRRVLKHAAKLVEVGLWHPRGDGWEIHDYAKYQEPALRAEVNRRKEYERERKRTQRARSDSRSIQSTPSDTVNTPAKSVDSPTPRASVPNLSRRDTSAMSPEDAQVASRSSGPVRSGPIRPVPTSRQTRAHEVSAQTAISAQSSTQVQELIEVLGERCPAALLFDGAKAPGIRGALDQRLAEVGVSIDRGRYEILGLWYAAGAMAWRKTRLGLRELSTKEGMLAEHIEAAVQWDREGRPPFHQHHRATAERDLALSDEGEASAEDPLLAQARRRRGPRGDRQ